MTDRPAPASPPAQNPADAGAPPVADTAWPEQIEDLRLGFAGALNVYRVMAHHPALLRAWAPLRQHVVKDSALGLERSEVVILRVGHRLGSEYEWVHHVTRARALGFSDARILALRGAPSGEDGLIMRAVDALMDEHRLPPCLEAELSAALGKAGVFDLIATVGFYRVLGSLLLTYAPPIDEDVAAEFAATPL
ncbi:MAG: carboxymuconolactone decarboxylase family protein [Neomegalonema sp.]|nr:carboxymuconolactone decarboxylase family protein [Neomegalonema sp.]